MWDVMVIIFAICIVGASIFYAAHKIYDDTEKIQACEEFCYPLKHYIVDHRQYCVCGPDLYQITDQNTINPRPLTTQQTE